MAERTQRAVGVGKEHSSDAMRYRKQTLLALDVRSQKLGFVVFEGPTKLLSWGTRDYSGTGQRARDAVVKRINDLLDHDELSVLVIRKIHVDAPTTAKHLQFIITTIREEAKRRSVKVHILSAAAVKKFFTQLGWKTKHEIASTLAEWFEVIAWKLPNKKKTWQSERHNMVIFDAVATGVTFFGLRKSAKEADRE